MKGISRLQSWAMNDDDPALELEALRAEHRALDEQISALSVAEGTDQLELARMKRRKLYLKDRIQLILDSNTPDIIA
jgi:hypothetical protein